MLALLLVVIHLGVRQTNLGDHAAEIGVRVPESGLQNVNDLPVVKPEACEMFIGLNH
jgi:hypothetical protein